MSAWIYVYLPYSVAFLALGLVMVMAARAPVPVLPRASLWLLAAFGFFHGLHEWIEMAELIQSRSVGGGSLAFLDPADLFLIAFSYAFVMQAGIEILIPLRQWPKWSRCVPIAVLLIWAGVFVALAVSLGFMGNTEWEDAGDALARYILGFPGSLLISYSFLVAARAPREIASDRITSYLTGAAIAFAGYAVFTFAGVPPAPFFPASLINTRTLLAATHVPAEAFRAIFAVAIAGFLGEACVVEAAWIQAELKRLREEFVSIVAHDLRAPITTITLSAGMIDRLPSGGHETDQEQTLLRNIETSARRLNRMVEDLLDASRIEAKQLAMKKETVDIGQLVREAVDRSAQVTRGHIVRVDIPDSTPPVEADPGRIEQVVTNLLSNAAKYSYPNTEIRVEIRVGPRELIASVTNYGPGITSEEKTLVFTRFYRAKEVERPQIPGLGLGLYIAKGIVEAHGGRIWVESEVGKATTFRFTLPLKLSALAT
ncbi:MAG: ATP-binding protein [Chloroflexi bacterium]|nr:ATP-binding protein [Chloroflexota bacterium]